MDNNNYYSGQSFIVVKYGDNEEALFNPWCTITTLVEWIRKKCHCDDNEISTTVNFQSPVSAPKHTTTEDKPGDLIDLVDLDGQVKHLSAQDRQEYASDVVNGRETYVLIRIERQGENEPSKYISLLNNLEKLNPELMGKLADLSKPSKSRKDRRKNTRGSKVTTGRDSPSKRPASSDRKNRTVAGKH